MGRFADLSGKVAIVTGGAVGIGGAIGSALAENGVSVAVVDKDPIAAEKKAAALLALGAGSTAVVCDVTQSEQVRQMVDEVVQRYGRIDILVNCAGSMFGGKTTLTVSPDEWDVTFALCLRSHYLCARAVLPHMIERGWGRIVNISSDAGRLPVRLTSPAYAAAKAGVIGFTKHLALEVARQGITVNATVPGTTLTPRTQRTFALAAAAPQLSADRPRSGHGGLHGHRHCRDVPRPDRGDGSSEGASRQHAAPIHPGAHRILAAGPPAAAAIAQGGGRGDRQLFEHSFGVPLSSPLCGQKAMLRPGGAGIVRGEARALGCLPSMT